MKADPCGAATCSIRIQPLGDAAVAAVLGDAYSPCVLQRVWALRARLADVLGNGALDVVSAYASVVVRFDPTAADLAAMMAAIRGALEDERAIGPPDAPLVEIEVDFAPDKGLDLDGVAQYVGIPPDEVVALFCGAEYEVAFLGFTAGFPYLFGLPPRLWVPRLPSPRARVPAGSVAIAAGQAGIYPRTTPGGWRVLGRTNVQLFDPERNPPCLLQPGQRVRFRPAGSPHGQATPIPDAVHGRAATVAEGMRHAEPAMEILEPGALTTVQDGGRRHVGAMGVSPSGWVDWFSARLANRLAGNPQTAAVLEITLTGCVFRALVELVVAVTGAEADLTVDGVPKALWRSHLLRQGSVVRIGPARRGARSYLAVRGGVAVPRVLGSCSTDVGCGFGGFEGRSLRRGDRLHKGGGEPGEPNAPPFLAFPQSLHPAWERRVRLRVLPGLQMPPANPDTFQRKAAGLLGQTFRVSSVGNRQGVRLEGQPTPSPHGSEIVSTGMCAGCVQVTGEGLPIILLAEHPTTGGYAVPFVVMSADLPRCGQLQPGDEVTFVPVTVAQARHALAAVMRDLHAPLAEVSA